MTTREKYIPMYFYRRTWETSRFNNLIEPRWLPGYVSFISISTAKCFNVFFFISMRLRRSTARHSNHYIKRPEFDWQGSILIPNKFALRTPQIPTLTSS